MINSISQITNLGSNFSTNSINNSNKSFGNLLNSALNDVNNLQAKSQQDDNALIMGDINNIHNVMIDAAKADIALQLTIQIKNKILDAYQEVMRMPV